MQPGTQIGPFVVEKELGSGAMGSVYRARYTKTGQRIALKLVGLSLAANAQALARFEREANILKQLHHPNIVRLFGTGRHQGTPYYAMEYVEGESLDRSLARRGRMTWEELVTLGQQLCSALQHAHEKGIVHRDLKPSNLMMLPDGTVKLTDFGIAKDLDVTQLTSANCTVGTASYMSPEQCKGDPNLTHKSDLYSMGIVFYELLTGRKPFTAETPMDMFMQHIQGTFERPSKVVLETPRWLDTLICQLMEKKPEQRPRDAETVGKSLEMVSEKVSARASAGVDAVNARAIDRARSAAPVEETDREAARTLKAGAAGKKLKKKKRKPFYERAWFQAAGIVSILIVMGGMLWWIFGPPSAERLYGEAERRMKAAGDDADMRSAVREGPIAAYLQQYGSRTDERTQKVRGWADEVDAAWSARRLDRLLRSARGKVTLKTLPQTDAEKDALEAADAEDDGDLGQLETLWTEIEKKYRDDPESRSWSVLARAKLREFALVRKELQVLLTKIELCANLDRAYLPDTDLERETEEACKAEIACKKAATDPQVPQANRDALQGQARSIWEKLKKKAESEAGMRVTYLIAAKRLHDLTRPASGK